MNETKVSAWYTDNAMAKAGLSGLCANGVPTCSEPMRLRVHHLPTTPNLEQITALPL